MIRRILQPSEEKVYGIYDQDESSTTYIGKVLVHKFGCVVFKEESKMGFSWSELDSILSIRPEEAVK